MRDSSCHQIKYNGLRNRGIHNLRSNFPGLHRHNYILELDTSSLLENHVLVSIGQFYLLVLFPCSISILPIIIDCLLNKAPASAVLPFVCPALRRFEITGNRHDIAPLVYHHRQAPAPTEIRAKIHPCLAGLLLSLMAGVMPVSGFACCSLSHL